jgi:signal transduction histidine kinase
MTQSEIGHAFERFYRGPTQIGRSAGTGIGLWISQAFALACNAEIRIESAGRGLGTTASVDVPLRPSSPQEEPGQADD